MMSKYFLFPVFYLVMILKYSRFVCCLFLDHTAHCGKKQRPNKTAKFFGPDSVWFHSITSQSIKSRAGKGLRLRYSVGHTALARSGVIVLCCPDYCPHRRHGAWRVSSSVSASCYQGSDFCTFL